MSSARSQLQSMARAEAAQAWASACRAPARFADASARWIASHPSLALGAAATLAAALQARGSLSSKPSRKRRSWWMAGAALALRWIPDALKLSGLMFERFGRAPRSSPPEADRRAPGQG